MRPATAIEPASRAPVAFGPVYLRQWLPVAWPWCVVLLAGLALVPVMLLGLVAQEVDRLRLARVQIIASEVQDRLEADLLLGLDLPASSGAQSLLEKTLSRDPDLAAAEVFDAAGIALFNTDRGSIGERIPAAWAQAVAGRPESRLGWSVGDPVTVVGVALRDPSGEPVGQLALSLRPLPQLPAAEVMLWSSPVLLALALAITWAVRRNLREHLDAPLAPAVAAGIERLEATEAQLSAALARLMADEGHLAKGAADAA